MNVNGLSTKDPSLLQGRELLIFDFDGTVADTTLLHAAAFRQVLGSLGVDVDYSRIAGLKTEDAIRQCLVGSDWLLTDAAIAELIVAKQQCVRGMITQGLCPLPGVDSFLRRARLNYQIAMVTSGSRGTVELSLQKLGYQDWFAPLVCADDVAHAKPHPDGFTLALRLAGVDAGAALVFEDSEAGFTAAEASGLDFVDVRSNPWSTLEKMLS